MKDVWVISLGGSRIVPDEVDDRFLLDFKKLLDSHLGKRFVVVCGGGSTARKYIGALKRLGKGEKDQSMEGIVVTRLHAGFMARFYWKSANKEVPLNMKKVKGMLKKNRVVFCGALRWRDKNTSDGTAAKIAGFLKCPFINLTDVDGLYTMDPKKDKRAKFVPRVSWADFLRVTKKVKFEAGQHFILDLVAAKEIAEKRIPTYIVGSLWAMDGILRGKRFVGTRVGG